MASRQQISGRESPAAAMRRAKRDMNPARVVIVGAGFGGLAAAKAIRRTPHRVLQQTRRKGHKAPTSSDSLQSMRCPDESNTTALRRGPESLARQYYPRPAGKRHA